MPFTNNKKLKITGVATAAFLFFIFQSFAANKHGEPGPTETESKLWLVGDSSLHAYSSTAHNLKVDLGLAADKPAFEQLKSGAIKTLEVVVPVKDMRSGKDGLDKNMQKALKAEENPNIIFHLDKYEVKDSTTPTQGKMVSASGTLEIGGVKNAVILDGTLTEDGSGARIQGVEDLLMTDYGIKPPKILVIKTSNEVKVHYDLRLDEKGRLK